MKILFLCLDLTYPPSNGLTMRTWSVARALAADGHQVHMLGFGSGGPFPPEIASLTAVPFDAPSLTSAAGFTARVQSLGRGQAYSATRFTCPAMGEAVERALASGGYDAVLADSTYSTQNLPAKLNLPLIINTHNLEYRVLQRFAAQERHPVRRTYAALEWRWLRLWEANALARAQLILACSDIDQAGIESLAPGVPCFVIPNAVSTTYYRPAPGNRFEPDTVLYTGGLDWHPNRDAVMFFARDVMPRLRQLVPSVRFLIAGRTPPPGFARRLAAIPDVHYLGQVPDMRPIIAHAHMCVIPLRMGSGTRLKILEAAAMGKPMVSTDLGAEGLSFRHERDILLANSADELARATARVLLSRILAARLGASARATVERLYSQAGLQLELRAALGPVPRRRIEGARAA
ncbi:MAG TPA: glycosyltransferase family 4 protein [Terriglobales bacterium]|jgi:glycosyltransferase involved in cell wall biosynthesis